MHQRPRTSGQTLRQQWGSCLENDSPFGNFPGSVLDLLLDLIMLWIERPLFKILGKSGQSLFLSWELCPMCVIGPVDWSPIRKLKFIWCNRPLKHWDFSKAYLKAAPQGFVKVIKKKPFKCARNVKQSARLLLQTLTAGEDTGTGYWQFSAEHEPLHRRECPAFCYWSEGSHACNPLWWNRVNNEEVTLHCSVI